MVSSLSNLWSYFIRHHPRSLTIKGNETGHKLAQKLQKKRKVCPHSFITARALMYQKTAQFLISSGLKKKKFYESDTGRFLKSIDKGLPNDHTCLLHNNRPKTEAVIPSQLRTGISRLNSCLFRIGAANSDQGICSKGKKQCIIFSFHALYGRNFEQKLCRAQEGKSVGATLHFC